MAAMNLPSPEELRQLLDYDPETGVFTWRERTPDMFEDVEWPREYACKTWNSNFAGRAALRSVSTEGYLEGNILGKSLKAHRAAYALQTGKWPDALMDHINGKRDDNRWSNLRAVTPLENNRNMARPSSNTSGLAGVHFHARDRRWVARIRIHYTERHLGNFIHKFDAVLARLLAEKEMGFTYRHGLAA